jgi:hypothetical protein
VMTARRIAEMYFLRLTRDCADGEKSLRTTNHATKDAW